MRHIDRPIWMHITALALIVSACTSAPETAEVASSPLPAQVNPSPGAGSEIPFGESVLVVKQLERSEAHWLMPVDPRTGVAVAGYAPIELGVNFHHRLAPDGSTLVVVGYPTQSSDAVVHFIDLDSWSASPPLELSTRGWTSAMAISHDGSRLVIATVERGASSLWLVDVLRQELVSRLEIPHFVVDMRYGEATIMLYARQENTETGLSEGPPVAELRSAADLTLAWSTELEDVRDGFEPYEPGKGAAHEPGAGTTYRPAVLLDPLAGMMYIVHADVDRITRVDFAKRETPTQDIRPALTLFERWLALGATAAHAKVQDGIERRALLSPDGEVAYTAGVKSKFKQDSVGSWELMQSHLPLQAIRLWDASELYRSDVQADTLEIASDGETMLLQRWAMTAGETESTTFVNAASGEVMGDVAGAQLHAATRMDGTPLLVASSFRGPGRGTSTLTAYDLDTLLLGAWDAPRYADWVLLRK